jgi:hypothetical protein
MPNSTWVGDYSLEFDDIDQGLLESDILDARVVEPVNIVPDCGSAPTRQEKPEDELTVDLLLLVILVLDSGDVDGSLVGEKKTVGSEVLVPGKENGVEHGFVEKEVTHPLFYQFYSLHLL